MCNTFSIEDIIPAKIKLSKYSVRSIKKSFIMEVSTNKEEIYMKNMTNQTVQTYKGGTLT